MRARNQQQNHTTGSSFHSSPKAQSTFNTPFKYHEDRSTYKTLCVAADAQPKWCLTVVETILELSDKKPYNDHLYSFSAFFVFCSVHSLLLLSQAHIILIIIKNAKFGWKRHTNEKNDEQKTTARDGRCRRCCWHELKLLLLDSCSCRRSKRYTCSL